jgi:hypothetical protein
MSEEQMTGTDRTPAQPGLSDFFDSRDDGAHRARDAEDTDPDIVDDADTDVDVDDEFGTPPARHRRIPPVTGLLVLGVMLALTFTGGVLTQKHHDAGTSAASSGFPGLGAGGFPAGLGGGAPGAATSGGTGATGGTTTTAGPAVIGTVVKVVGQTMTVKDLGGKSHVIHLTGTTKATKTTTVDLDALKAGTTVTVSGTTSADGSVSAATITTR